MIQNFHLNESFRIQPKNLDLIINTMNNLLREQCRTSQHPNRFCTKKNKLITNSRQKKSIKNLKKTHSNAVSPCRNRHTSKQQRSSHNPCQGSNSQTPNASATPAWASCSASFGPIPHIRNLPGRTTPLASRFCKFFF